MSPVTPMSVLSTKNKFFFFLGFCVSRHNTNRAIPGTSPVKCPRYRKFAVAGSDHSARR